jgi:hypothetical protein
MLQHSQDLKVNIMQKLFKLLASLGRFERNSDWSKSSTKGVAAIVAYRRGVIIVILKHPVFLPTASILKVGKTNQSILQHSQRGWLGNKTRGSTIDKTLYRPL